MNVLSALCDADSSPGIVNFKFISDQLIRFMLAAYRYISDTFIGKLISGFLATSLLRADNQCSSKIRPHQEFFH